MLPLYFTIITVVVLFFLSSTNNEINVQECVSKISKFKTTNFKYRTQKPNPEELKEFIDNAIIITNTCGELLTEDEILNMENCVFRSYESLYDQYNDEEKSNQEKDKNKGVISSVVMKSKEGEENDLPI